MSEKREYSVFGIVNMNVSMNIEAESKEEAEKEATKFFTAINSYPETVSIDEITDVDIEWTEKA